MPITIKSDAQPVIYGILHTQKKDYPIRSFSWLSFMLRINEIMRETTIEFPLGEDDEIRMVRKPINKIERFKR